MNLKYLLTICLFPLGVFSQSAIRISFDDANNLDLITIDTVSNPNNIWKIGKPQKSIFDNAYSKSNALVTDLINSYPTNDTSTFYMWYTSLDTGNWPILDFWFKIDSDSSRDFGEIMFSPDKGVTWYGDVDPNLPLTLTCNCKDVLTGTGNGEWNWYYHVFIGWDTYFAHSDSVLFKFIFYSDSISESMDGWMIDDIKMYDFVTGIKENKRDIYISVTPNPAQETLRIQFLDPNIRDTQELKIYSITGQLVLRQMINPPESEINIETLESGVYMYAIGDHRGKMVVE